MSSTPSITGIKGPSLLSKTRPQTTFHTPKSDTPTDLSSKQAAVSASRLSARLASLESDSFSSARPHHFSSVSTPYNVSGSMTPSINPDDVEKIRSSLQKELKTIVVKSSESEPTLELKSIETQIKNAENRKALIDVRIQSIESEIAESFGKKLTKNASAIKVYREKLRAIKRLPPTRNTSEEKRKRRAQDVQDTTAKLKNLAAIVKEVKSEQKKYKEKNLDPLLFQQIQVETELSDLDLSRELLQSHLDRQPPQTLKFFREVSLNREVEEGRLVLLKPEEQKKIPVYKILAEILKEVNFSGNGPDKEALINNLARYRRGSNEMNLVADALKYLFDKVSATLPPDSQNLQNIAALAQFLSSLIEAAAKKRGTISY